MSPPLLLSVFPTFAVGGAQSRFATLANHLGPTWRHAIVAMDGVTSARERLDDNVEVSFPKVEIRKGDLLGNIRRFRAAMRDLAPTTLLTHNFGSIEWAMANRHQIVPHVHVEDGFGPEERQTQLPRRVWLRRIFLRGRRVVLPSRTLLEIAQNTWRLRDSDLFYVPNGVDLERFRSPPPAAKPDITVPTIGTIAALRPEKNIARLIRAFAIVAAKQQARLLLIGDGAQRRELEVLADDLGIAQSVNFAGHRPNPAELLETIDIFAMSSDTEQMPISLLEAMAAGRPVVATNVGDIRSMLPEVGRPFVTSCEDDELASALLRLVADKSLRQVLGQANQARVAAAFDQADMFASWTALLEGRPVTSAKGLA